MTDEKYRELNLHIFGSSQPGPERNNDSKNEMNRRRHNYLPPITVLMVSLAHIY